MPDNDLRKIVKNFLLNLPNYSDKIKLAVSYSGGIDSAVLLDIILDVYKSGKILNPKIVYFNHNLRGDESAKEKEFILNKFSNIKFDLEVIDLDVNKLSIGKSISIEAAARELRYFHLENIAKDVDYILLGHHKDDNVETVFFNFLRGTGLQGLAGIRSNRGKYLRPMLDVSKQEIIEYAEKKNIQYVTDSSNLKNEFSRNRIRNKIIPMIENELNRNIKNSIYNLSQNISEVNEYLDRTVSDFISDKDKAIKVNKSLFILNRDVFLKVSIVIQKLIVNYCLQAMNMDYNLDNKSIRAIIDHIVKNGENILEYFDHKIEVFGNNIIILGPDFTSNDLTSVAVSERTSEFYFDPAKVNEMKYDTISIEDEFTPFGKKNPEKIRKVLSDKKIPKIFRDRLHAISDGNKVIFIQGVGISNDIRADETTVEKKFITIKNNYLENLF